MSMMLNSYAFGAADDFSAAGSLTLNMGVPVDESGNQTFQVYNFPVWDNAVAAFGTRSMRPGSLGGAFATVSNIDLGSGDFTIEAFVMASAEPASGSLCGRYGPSGSRSWVIQYDNPNNRFTAFLSTDGVNTASCYYDFDTDGSISLATFFNNTKRHIALVRSGSTLKMYVEGVAGAATGTLSGAIYTGGTNLTIIGAAGASGASPAGALLVNSDEYRMTIGNARYTSNFTPPAGAFGRNSTDDAAWANVKLLLGMETPFAAGQSGTVATLLVNNGATNAISFDANGMINNATQVERVPYDPEFNLGSGDFTLEAYGLKKVGAAWSAEASGSGIAGCWSSTAGDACWQLYVNASHEFAFRWSADGTTTTGTLSSGVVGAADTVYNLAVVRDGSSLYFYLNGSRVASTSISGSLQAASVNSTPMGILGGFTSGGGNSGTLAANARIKAVRLKHSARFKGASYAVPALPLP